MSRLLMFTKESTQNTQTYIQLNWINATFWACRKLRNPVGFQEKPEFPPPFVPIPPTLRPGSPLESPPRKRSKPHPEKKDIDPDIPPGPKKDAPRKTNNRVRLSFASLARLRARFPPPPPRPPPPTRANPPPDAPAPRAPVAREREDHRHLVLPRKLDEVLHRVVQAALRRGDLTATGFRGVQVWLRSKPEMWGIFGGLTQTKTKGSLPKTFLGLLPKAKRERNPKTEISGVSIYSI